MDIRMPGIGGVEATRLILEKNPHIKVLILTTFDDDVYIIDALNYGASGYLLKDIGKEKLIESMREALAGNILITGKVAYKLAKSIKSNKKPSTNGNYNPFELTEREIVIARLMVQGLNNKEIGTHLNLTQGTIKNYMSAIYLKLGVSDRSKAIVLLSSQL
jgi:DNA-binding NarL/FixJ family response regulator